MSAALPKHFEPAEYMNPEILFVSSGIFKKRGDPNKQNLMGFLFYL